MVETETNLLAIHIYAQSWLHLCRSPKFVLLHWENLASRFSREIPVSFFRAPHTLLTGSVELTRKTAVDRGWTDRISLTHDLDLDLWPWPLIPCELWSWTTHTQMFKVKGTALHAALIRSAEIIVRCEHVLNASWRTSQRITSYQEIWNFAG